MTSTFPSILNTYSDPLATDRLNSPSHSGVETNQNSGIKQVERVIGVEGSASVVGSLQYLIKSPASTGGGHVQGAAYGGTGQTTFTKGDILVAQSASVLTKLAVGTNGQIPVADSTAATGISWGNNSNPKIATVTSVIILPSPTTSVFALSVPGSTLGTTNAIRTTGYFSLADLSTGFVAKVFLNGASVMTLNIPAAAGGTNVGGTITHTVIASTLSIQSNFTEVRLAQRGTAIVGSVFGAFGFNTSSVQSSASILVSLDTSGFGGNGGQFNGVIMEKIS